MKTMIRMVLPAVVTAAMVWAVPCRGQGLDIEIAVPEPGKSAPEGKPEGKEAKRKTSQRSEGREAPRRNARQRADEPLPAVEVNVPQALDLRMPPALLADEEESSDHPEPAPMPPPSPRPRAGAFDEKPRPEPSWANPAAIPLRQDEKSAAAPKSQRRDPKPAGKDANKTASASRKSAGRSESPKSESSASSGFLSRFLQSKRRQAGQEQASAQVARRDRAAPPPDRREASLAPPSPWGEPR